MDDEKMLAESRVRSMQEVEGSILLDLYELDDRFLQYSYLIECGSVLPPMSAELKTDDFLIRECEVRTWAGVLVGERGRCEIFGDSESLAVRGALALLKEVADGRTRQQVAEHKWRLLDDPGFASHFTERQLSGLRAVVRRIGARS